MNIPSTIIGKSVFTALRLSGRTGSALPGLVVEKLDGSYLSGMLAQLPRGVIVVSGTNGKTTTTKLITKLLESQGLRVLTNPTGSNFVRGIISAVVDKASWSGKLAYDIAVFEQDEAHAVHFVQQVRPNGVLVLNVMRDQMDRFGEIDTTLKLLQKLASSATDFVVLNANDERVDIITIADGVKKVWFAHSEELQAEFLTDDQLYHAESAQYALAGTPAVELTGYDEASVSLRIAGTPHRYPYQLQGGHNALNLAAALEDSIAYAKQRVQFAKPIAEFQAVQWMIADMAKDVQAARLMIVEAARLLDGGGRATLAASMAKCFAADAAVARTADAVQIHGGSGYIRGVRVERLYRDAKITQIYEGTNQIQRMIMARTLLS